MFTPKALFYEVYIFFVILSFRHVNSEIDKKLLEKRFEEAKNLAQATALTFITLFESCIETTMINQQFSEDNLQKFIAWPPRTTVGFVPKFTSNRKFFANLISTTAFKEMLAKDEDELRVQHIHKMKYCDDVIMDSNVLKDFYDREVDQSKI